jgi:predicted deacylase
VFALVVGGDVGLVPDDEQVLGVLVLDQQADESGCVTGEVDPLDAVEQDAAVAVNRPPVEVVVEVGGEVRAVVARLRGEVGVWFDAVAITAPWRG